MRPWNHRILDLVERGVIQREEIIRQVLPFIPIGHAYRAREADRQRYERNRPDGLIAEYAAKAVTTAQIHRAGARQVLNHAMRSLVANGYLYRVGSVYIRTNKPRPK